MAYADASKVGSPGLSGAEVLIKINTMVSSNITILLVLLVVMIVLGFGLFYFVKSLMKTLHNYYSNRSVVDTSGADSLKDKTADNEEYPDTSDPDNQDDGDLRAVIDPTNFMPKSKRDFLTSVKLENKEYNAEKTQFVTRRLNYIKNDDVVDDKILYKDYDDYDYTIRGQDE